MPSSSSMYLQMLAMCLAVTCATAVPNKLTDHLRQLGAPFKVYDNSWCFRGVYDYDNCPEKSTLHACVRCCSDLPTYYDNPPSKNVCLAACADKFPKLGIEWTYL